MKETTENNKLLAEFLGWDKYETFEDSEEYCLTCVEELHLKIGDFNIYSLSELKFHNDWNWLMLVVDKIEETNLGSLEMQSKNLVLLQYNYKTEKYYNSTLIENVYNACIQFVKWYNENK